MYFKSLDYPIIVIDDDYESPRIGGILIRALVEELRKNDQRVLCGLTWLTPRPARGPMWRPRRC